ncbi:VOC family protein [Paenibacillus sp. Marseille-Q4541]|uniref:VOC family protein n=1 Tax=Paenibacillus sp. Marseille-Q4541 TaxID=2831522 RepID=UPI001BAE5407|nr:VOC family protein [Paenibacillus sp. Marseille-Q4541]
MLSISPYINLDGKCAEAVAFYEKVFGAKNLGVMRFGDMPGSDQPTPDHLKDRVLHAAIEIDGNKIMFSDTMPGSSFTLGDELTIAITSNELDRLKQFYEGLAEEGEVQMEQQATFFSPLYAIVRDKYGITWQLSGEKE